MKQRRGTRRTGQSVGIALDELIEESRFGRNARRELVRWFPGATWVKQLAVDPKQRELALIDRRTFLWTLGLAPAVSLVSGCPVDAEEGALLLFTAVRIAASLYGLGDPAAGVALFTNSSQSREGFQLLTSLLSGEPSKPGEVQDERDYEVNVPAKSNDYMHLFDDLFASQAGDHYVSGQAIGETRNSEVFRYEE